MPEHNPLSRWHSRPLPGPETHEGRYVRLVPLSAESHTADLWDGVQGHDEVWDYLADGPYAAEADLAAAIEQKAAGTVAVFLAIVPKSSGRAEGYASYMRIDPANGVLEVGNILMAPTLQKTTAATEAMYLMARHVFEDLGYRRYEWKCDSLNAASRAAAERLGFSFEGVFRQATVYKGRSRDTAWFAAIDAEWPALRAAFQAWLAPANFDADGRQRTRLSDLTKPLLKPRE